MSLIPPPINTLVNLIDKYHEDQKQEPRRHLGCSIIGQNCDRKIWYQFRWAKEADFDGRILRLFRRGQNEEDTVCRDLEAIGCKVTDRQQYVNFGGFVSGSIDGIVIGLPEAPKTKHILEIKTHSKKSFDDLIKSGVKKSKPEHYDQMSLYMLGTGLDRALYFAVCKDDDRIYTERVPLVKSYAEDLVRKAIDISLSRVEPRRVSEREDWFECRFCNFHGICHKGEKMQKNCRTCKHSEPKEDGTWHCNFNQDTIPKEFERQGCREWQSL